MIEPPKYGIHDDEPFGAASSLAPSPIPSNHSTRPPSAAYSRGGPTTAPLSGGSGLRPLSADSTGGRNPPSITPLDGGGGPDGVGGDFHLGVLGMPQGGSAHGGNVAVSWQ